MNSPAVRDGPPYLACAGLTVRDELTLPLMACVDGPGMAALPRVSGTDRPTVVSEAR
jgi:hypothetical protein